MKRLICVLICVMMLSSCGMTERIEDNPSTTTVSSSSEKVTRATTAPTEDDSDELEVVDWYYENIKNQSLILPKDIEVVDTYIERWFESYTEYSFTAKDYEEAVDLSDVFELDQLVDPDTIYDVERVGDYIAFRTGSDMTAYLCKANDTDIEVIAKGTGLSVGYAVTEHYIFFAEGYSQLSSSEPRMYVIKVATGEIVAVDFPMPYENTFISTISSTSDGGMVVVPNTGASVNTLSEYVYYISPENIVINATELFLPDEVYGFTYDEYYEALTGKWDVVVWYDVPTVNDSYTKLAYWSNKYAEDGEMRLEPGIWIVDLKTGEESRLDLGDLSPTVGYISWIDDETLMFDTYDNGGFYEINLEDNTISNHPEPSNYDEYYESVNSQSLILPEDVEIVEADTDEWFHSFMKYGFTVSDINGNYAYGTYSDVEEEKRYEAVYDITTGEFTELTELEETNMSYSLDEDDVDISDIVGLDNIVSPDTMYDIKRTGNYIAFRAGDDMTSYVCEITDDGVRVIAKGIDISVSYAVTDNFIFFTESYTKLSSSEMRVYVLNVATGEIIAVDFSLPFEEPYITTLSSTSEGGIRVRLNEGESSYSLEEYVYYMTPGDISRVTTEHF